MYITYIVDTSISNYLEDKLCVNDTIILKIRETVHISLTNFNCGLFVFGLFFY